MEALISEVKNDLKNNDPAAAVARVKEQSNQQRNTPLNIAITGESGSGKSTFVNAFRGISDEDDGAAPTNIVEASKEPIPYFHPDYPNVNVWDLPGIGTTKFPANEYLKHIGFEKFDFFIIISDTRFRENDVKLAQEIQKMKKKFYFVRSKIDNDIRAAGRKKDFNEKTTLDIIRKSCDQDLLKQGISSPRIFLVSSFELHLYDFSRLYETLGKDLPEHKRDALLFATSNINLEIIKKKKEAFQSKIKYYASLSACVAAIPLPGVSTAFDVALMAITARDYVHGFGLDKSSLQRLSARTRVPYRDMLAVTMSPLVAGEITEEVMLKMLPQLAGITALMAIEEAVRLIPIIGIIASAGLSGIAIYNVLNYFLDTLAKDAQSVFERSLTGP
ncbi:interferon-inducible GTPase 5-like [Archocentrus centrarchus]|uniref:interferon-inducible GTPase 5-like n=1 Tax=Archocentrus centrarchus TaxID=63155 RepID=UPI0011EA08FF|nr:interferon-inducible GTPase 5-like [Archocentrus centrarchus]